MRLVRNIFVFLILTLTSIVMVWAQNTEAKNLGSSFASARVSEHDHALARIAEAEAQLNLQSVSVLYEHDKAWPRWSYKNNIVAYRKLVAMVKQVASKKEGSVLTPKSWTD